jgi:hypothetical protein
MAQKQPPKVKKTVQVDSSLLPLLSVMLKKANLTLSDLNDSAIRRWINQNTDLLSPVERERFKDVLL